MAATEQRERCVERKELMANDGRRCGILQIMEITNADLLPVVNDPSAAPFELGLVDILKHVSVP